MTLPNALHAPMVIEAARHGLHVVGEKPMATSTDECRQMIEAAKYAGVVLASAQCMEWTSPIIKTRELLESGVDRRHRQLLDFGIVSKGPDPEHMRQPRSNGAAANFSIWASTLSTRSHVCLGRFPKSRDISALLSKTICPKTARSSWRNLLPACRHDRSQRNLLPEQLCDSRHEWPYLERRMVGPRVRGRPAYAGRRRADRFRPT